MAEGVGLSFSFSKTKEVVKLKESAIKESEHIKESDNDFVTSFIGNEFQSVRPKEKKRELIIPLISKNKWKNAKKPSDLDRDDVVPEAKKRRTEERTSGADGDDVEKAAITELLQEAAEESERWEERGGGASSQLAVPLLMQNKVPEGYETEDKLNVELRPDEPEEANYEEVPIEEYGMALLRGMGFKEGQGIGKNGKVFKPIEAVARPKGLGLGADRSKLIQANHGAGAKQTAGQNDEEVVLKKGCYAVVTSGKHTDLYGEVQGIDEDNNRVMVKMALSGEVVSLSQNVIRLVTKAEYSKYSKYINKGKSDKFKEADESGKGKSKNETHKDKKRKHRSPSRERDSDSHRDSDRRRKHRSPSRERDNESHRDADRRHKNRSSSRERDSDSHRDSDRRRKNRSPSKERDNESHRDSDRRHKSKHKHKSKSGSDRRLDPDRCENGQAEVTSKGSNERRPRDIWLRSHLRVRIIDPDFKKGKYFKSKVVIEDVVSLDNCVVRTEEGKLLEGLSQSQLETVIPRCEPAYVMLLSGKHKTTVAEVLRKDKASCIATVQLLSDRDVVIETHYDTICEYTGDVSTQLDF